MEKDFLINEFLKKKYQKKNKIFNNKKNKFAIKEHRKDKDKKIITDNTLSNDFGLMKNKKYYFKKIENKKHLIFSSIVFLLLFTISVSNKNIRKLNLINQITYIEEGDGGYREILGGDAKVPNQVIINGVVQNKATINYQLPNQNNNTIVIIYNTSLTTSSKMFYGMSNIVSIDLSEFDTSQVTMMNGMFQGCTKLKSLNLKNINTTLVKNMEGMFANCASLKIIDTSNFITPLLIKTRQMFYNCTSLISIDLSKLDTSKVTNMEEMFYKAESLVSLDLSNFIIYSCGNMNSMFNGCKSLIYINLISFAENKTISSNNFFNDDSKNVTYCIDESKSPKLFSKIKTVNANNDCDHICFSPNIKLIIEKKQCIDDCSKDDTYFFENHNICYKTPQPEENTEENTEKITEQITEKITEKITEQITEQITEKNTEENNELTEEMLNKESTYIPEEKTEKNENINNNIKSDIIQTFSSESFFKEKQQINIDNVSKKDEIIKNIKYDLINGNLDSLLQNVTGGLKQDLLAKDNDIIYQITTSDNQKNIFYSNISTINLGECENKLRGQYNISDNLTLIIFKVDYYMSGILIPVIGYEVYHPTNKSQLDLNYCKDTLIKLNIPVSINEDKVFIHDPNSDYYNDECYTYTTDNGTDILINDRQNEYIDNNLSLCENNCTFIGYDQNTKKALCECETKPKIGLISDIIKDENILANDFNYTDDSTSNIATMKCIDALFSEGLLTNIGSYLLLLTILFFAISVIVFYKCGFLMIEKKINEITENKFDHKKSLDFSNKKLKRQKSKSFSKKNTIKNDKNKKKIKIHLSNGNPLKRASKKNISKIINLKKEKDTSRHMSSSKLQVKSIDIMVKLRKKSNKIVNKKVKLNAKETIIKTKIYIDSELNLLDYNKAIIYDKRPFSKYYSSLVLSKHLIFFSFYPIKDYNVKIIKVSVFFLSIDIVFAINTLFFNDSSIHQIYSDGGDYNFSYFIPQIMYSFIISYVITNLIRYFTLSERLLIELKNEGSNKKLMLKVISTKRCLNIIYITFYVLSFTFLVVLWFYLSSFCAVYQNSQIIVFANSCIDIGIYLLYPFVYNILPALFRSIALGKNRRNKCIFNFSKFLQLL